MQRCDCCCCLTALLFAFVCPSRRLEARVLSQDEVCAQDDGALDLDACHFDATVGVLQGDFLADYRALWGPCPDSHDAAYCTQTYCWIQAFRRCRQHFARNTVTSLRCALCLTSWSKYVQAIGTLHAWCRTLMRTNCFTHKYFRSTKQLLRGAWSNASQQQSLTSAWTPSSR